MDHVDVRASLEVAAAEPGGLDRLMAGDTADAAAVAGHLAGCDSCTEEFARLRRSAALLREAVSTQPSAELRDRTLAFVAAVGRPRAVAAEGAAAPVPTPPSGRRGVGVVRGPLGWAAAAAIFVLAIGLTWTTATLLHEEERADQSREIAALGQLTAWQLRIEARDDAERVLLASSATSTDPEGPIGSLAFSRGSQEIVVTATGLEPPGAGREYRCWVSVDGEKERLGKMYFSADIAYWVGRVDVLDRVTDGSTFGVSLADTSAQGISAEPVLEGTL
jgi:hypothetical protein